MGILKFASEETKQLDLGEGDYVEVRADLSKRVFNNLVSSMPNREISEEKGLTLEEGLKFQQSLFEALVTGWSLPENPTLDAYLNLVRPAADAIDTALAAHFNGMQPTADEVSKVSTLRGTSRKGSGPTR